MDMVMDHDHSHGHGNGSDTNTCPMIMSFHASHCETILWKSWTARTIIEFFFSAFGIFIISFIYEYLKFLRERYYHSVAKAELLRITNAINAKRNQNNINNTTGSGGCCINLSEIEAQKTIQQKIFNRAHFSQTILHLIQITLSYLLMLIVMTYNYWLFVAVILGAACGYFCFGWIRQQSVDFNEHCH